LETILMMTFGAFARMTGAAALLAVIGASITPAFAGPAEVALLKSYEGNWRGRGTVVGSDTEKVTCRMSLTPGNQDKVNYAGRCALAGTDLAINGTLAYIDSNQRYEGAMTSNINFSGVAVGRKQDNGIVFSLKSRGMSDNANVEVTADIILTPGVITVKFNAVDVNTGKVLNASVPFSRI
jgi:hypothetical protein